MSTYIQLIATLGGSPEPLIASILTWQPEKVWFVPSRETVPRIQQEIVPKLAAEGFSLSPARYDVLELDDAQDFSRCIDQMTPLHTEVSKWQARGEGFQTYVDFTAGTKIMSAALALQAQRWKCRFSYVGGSQRTKDGTGTVVSGAESVVHAVNPWDALGFQAVDDFMALFDQGAYAPAATRMDHTLRMVDDKTRKRELASLKKLAELYDAWDRFDHRAALNKLRDTLQSANDLRAALRDVVLFDRVFGMLKNHEEVLGPLADSRGGGLVRDLLSNARRRDNESRWDDGTARLYRAIEAMAQDKLREQHGIDNTKKIPLERVPSPLREEWQSRARDNAVMVGLQDAYLLLKQLGDPLGEQFFASGLADREGSPLTSRNDSILAHGFTPISAKSFEALWRHALQLAGCTEHDLCQFPKLTTQ